MKALELERIQVTNLFNAMHSYINKVGRKADPLAAKSYLVITHVANEETVQKQNKAFAKLQKDLDRAGKKLAIKYAKLYEEGDKKGTFILDENKDFTFTPANQCLIEDELAVLTEEYEEAITGLQKEKVTIYIETVEKVPENLPVEFRNSLEWLIE